MDSCEIAARAAQSIEDSGARAWQRGASRWDHGFMEHEHFAAAWLRGWLRAVAEFSMGSHPSTKAEG